jgi:hypothetical protein
VNAKGLGLREQVLLAAFECCGGDCQRSFTAEELLVHAWEGDKMAWGLRGFEEQHPDSAKMFKELDAHAGKQGIVGRGLLERVHKRVYRLAPAGLAAISALRPSDPIAREKAGRRLEEEIRQIIEHPVYKLWRRDPKQPTWFLQAGHFWGIAPGTPSKTVRDRVTAVERTLAAASKFLKERGVDEVTEQRGKVLFDRQDIERCFEFQATLKERFARDLRLLDPGIELETPPASGSRSEHP